MKKCKEKILVGDLCVINVYSLCMKNINTIDMQYKKALKNL